MGMDPRARAILAVSMVLATLLYTIDTTIVNVALPNMQGSLQASQDQAAWILTAYIVISAIATPLAGWLGNRFGLRPVMLICIAGFTAGSMLCGVSNSITEMVLCRMLQGLFGAALVPLSQVGLMQEFPRESHGRVLALWGIGVMVGPIIGPTLGGWLTDTYSWRWAFYINLPIGVLAWLGVLLSMPRRRPHPGRPFDMKGFLMLSLAVGLGQLMLDRGAVNDWFSSTEILAEGFFAVVATYMFVVHSLTSRHPFVDIHLFKDRNFTVSLFLSVCIGAFVLSPSILLPGFLQRLQGYTPTQSGMILAARGLASIVGMSIAGKLISRVDPRHMVLVGVVIVITSLWQMGSFNVDTPIRDFIIAGVIQGVGIPLSFMALTFSSFATLPDSSRSEAGALQTLARNIGGSAGISIAVAYLTHSTQVNSSYLAEHFTSFATERWLMVGASPGANAPTALITGEVQRQALGIAYSNDFYLMAWAALICVPFALLLRKPGPRPAQAPPSAGDVPAVDAGH
jgi:DHA2 family multidrug resistance protein